jgi:hypothetical protein
LPCASGENHGLALRAQHLHGHARKRLIVRADNLCPVAAPPGLCRRRLRGQKRDRSDDADGDESHHGEIFKLNLGLPSDVPTNTGRVFVPSSGNAYAVYDCQLPGTEICTATGTVPLGVASWLHDDEAMPTVTFLTCAASALSTMSWPVNVTVCGSRPVISL